MLNTMSDNFIALSFAALAAVGLWLIFHIYPPYGCVVYITGSVMSALIWKS
jgi:hypothetical protein